MRERERERERKRERERESQSNNKSIKIKVIKKFPLSVFSLELSLLNKYTLEDALPSTNETHCCRDTKDGISSLSLADFK